jgi:hypothetical protein
MKRMVNESFGKGNAPPQLKRNDAVGNRESSEIKMETKPRI